MWHATDTAEPAQIGLLALQMPGVGLDVLGAESEGQIGCAYFTLDLANRPTLSSSHYRG